jgi:hypothetical protein
LDRGGIGRNSWELEGIPGNWKEFLGIGRNSWELEGIPRNSGIGCILSYPSKPM